MVSSITPALAADGPEIIRLFTLEKDIWPGGGKAVWFRFLQNQRRTERWDKLTVEGVLAGFVHWSMRVDNTRTIYDMIVHPDYRHQGIGRAMVEYVGRPVILKTTKSHAFYSKMGFIEGETIDGKTNFSLEKGTVMVPKGPWIMTYTGRIVNPLDLKPEEICIEDIAHGLALVNRFAGHTAKPISVAQHSVYVSRLVDGTPFTMQGLLHDASEAYLGDVTKWVKADAAFAVYRVAEALIQRLIYEKFKCTHKMSAEVARADRVMVMHEAVQGFGKAWPEHLNTRPGYDPITPKEMEKLGKWAPWPWRVSEESFLVRYRRCLEDQKA